MFSVARAEGEMKETRRGGGRDGEMEGGREGGRGEMEGERKAGRELGRRGGLVGPESSCLVLVVCRRGGSWSVIKRWLINLEL